MKTLLRNFSTSLLGLLLAGSSAFIVSSANGATVVSDSLIYADGSQSLIGTTPLGATSAWRVGDPYSTFTETATGTSESGGAQADLGVPNIVGGNIYTLSITESAPAAVGAILYLGFWNETTANGPTQGGSEFFSFAGATVEIGENGYANLDTNNGQIAQQTNTSVNGNGGPNLLTLVLNTEAPAWTVSATVNGGAVASYTYATNPTGLNSIYFATSSGANSVKFTNILLTGTGTSFTVPEPATYAYLVSGLLLLGVCLRRKRAMA